MGLAVRIGNKRGLRLQLRLGRARGRRHRIGLPAAEMIGCCRKEGLPVEAAGHHQHGVAGAVVRAEVPAQVIMGEGGDGLQRADCRLPQRMPRPEEPACLVVGVDIVPLFAQVIQSLLRDDPLFDLQVGKERPQQH